MHGAGATLQNCGDYEVNRMEITERHHKATGDIVDLIAEKIGKHREVHPATAISTCARLSGSMLFRSFTLSVPNAEPGNVVLSEEANEKGPILINILGVAIENSGNKIDKDKLAIAQKEDSNIAFIKSLELTQNQTIEIMKKYEMSYEDISYSCAMATGFIITQCQNKISTESGFNTAVYGFIEGTKTMPPELGKQNEIKKKFGFGKSGNCRVGLAPPDYRQKHLMG
jgi:hypothetical protein